MLPFILCPVIESTTGSKASRLLKAKRRCIEMLSIFTSPTLRYRLPRMRMQ